jgi:hypothetical protein
MSHFKEYLEAKDASRIERCVSLLNNLLDSSELKGLGGLKSHGLQNRGAPITICIVNNVIYSYISLHCLFACLRASHYLHVNIIMLGSSPRRSSTTAYKYQSIWSRYIMGITIINSTRSESNPGIRQIIY